MQGFIQDLELCCSYDNCVVKLKVRAVFLGRVNMDEFAMGGRPRTLRRCDKESSRSTRGSGGSPAVQPRLSP